MSQMAMNIVTFVVNTTRYFPDSWFITGFATSVTSGAEPANSAGAHNITSGFYFECLTFPPFSVDIVLPSLLRSTNSDYHFGNFKPF